MRLLISYLHLRLCSTIEWFAYNGKGNKERTVLLMSITDNLRNSLLGESVVLWTEPKNLSGLARNAIVKIVSVVGNGGNEAIVTIESSETVLYIVLTTAAQGRFVDNAFSLRKAEQKVELNARVV